MALQLKKEFADYRLLYLQPDPEDEERVCIGVLIQGNNRRPEILYDSKFSRVRCVAPAIDIDLINFYVEEMRQALVDAPSDFAMVSRQFGPMFVASEPRKVSVPLSDSSRLQLLHRFVLRTSGQVLGTDAHTSKKSRDVAFAEHLEAVVQGYLPCDYPSSDTLCQAAAGNRPSHAHREAGCAGCRTR